MPDSKFNKHDRLSRADLYGRDSPTATKMPDCDEVVKQAFLNCGCGLSGGMGLTPLTWCEIKAYSDLSRTNLSAWESDQVMMMSRTYCSFINKAKSETCVQPYWPDYNEQELVDYHKSISRLTENMEVERDSDGNVVKD